MLSYVLKVVHTQAKIIADQDVMYKYLSKNLIFVATVSPKAAGEIGSAAPEEASLMAYLIDAVSGRILHRVTHHGAQGPVHAVSITWLFIVGPNLVSQNLCMRLLYTISIFSQHIRHA